MGNLPKLSIIWLYSNNFSGGIPDSIGGMPSLAVFDVDDNDLGDGEGLPLVFVGNPNLEKLILSGNNWGGEIPNMYGDFPKLQYLGIEESGLTGPINPYLGNITTLTNLRIGTNTFTISTFPEFIFTMTQLEDLRMNECTITGNLPTGFGALKNLTTLHLQYNLLDGNLPAEIAELPLKSLILRNQFFSGPVPTEWQAMTGLTVFSVANNDLTGAFPVISGMTGLEELELQGNEFDQDALPNTYLSDVPTLSKLQKMCCTQNPYRSFPGA